MIELYDSKSAHVGGATVRRALPQRQRRTIGAWCFVDHFGPTNDTSDAMQIGPHPHIGLQTVTWLLDGQLVHRDSLGSEQPIRAGQLNLMTAGHGIAHAEEAPRTRSGPMHGAQLWVALPEHERRRAPAFEHHADLPAAEVGSVTVTVLVGELLGAHSPATAHTPLVGAELILHGDRAELPLDPHFEHAVVVLDGEVTVDGSTVVPGRLAVLAPGRESLTIDGRATALLLGGEPLDEKLLMWWNFVGRTWDDMAEAATAWSASDERRFGLVRSGLPLVPAPALPAFVTGDRT